MILFDVNIVDSLLNNRKGVHDDTLISENPPMDLTRILSLGEDLDYGLIGSDSREGIYTNFI